MILEIDMAKHEEKTNVMRILDQKNIWYLPHSYEPSDGSIDALSVAEKVGVEDYKIYKTLVTVGASGNHYVFVIPIEEEIDFKKAAKAAGEKSLEMLPLKDLTKVTGYVRGGCTSIGMKKQYPTFIQATARDLDQITVSGGRIGLQITLAPEDLRRAAGAEFADVIHS